MVCHCNDPDLPVGRQRRPYLTARVKHFETPSIDI
jgi:hypothetical protein